MRIILALLLFMISFLGGAWYYAQQLPREIQQTSSIRIAGDASSIWTKLTNAKDYPNWRSGMRAVMPITSDSLGLKEWKEVFARKVLLVRRLDAFVPDSLTLEFIPEERNVRTTWVWTLEPLPPESLLVTLTSTRVLGTPLFRLSNKIFGSEDEQQSKALEDLSH